MATSDPTLAVQAALYAVLTAAPFQAACGQTVGVYDDPPAGAALPYVVISDIQTDGAAAQGYDASDVHANLTVWSNAPNTVQLKGIAAQIRQFLAPRSDNGAPFALVGHRLITWTHMQTRSMREPDGISSKAIVSILFETEPTS